MLKKRLAQIILLFSVVVGFSLVFYTSQPNKVLAQTATPPNFKVAFIGDTGEGNNFQNVLNLIKAEGADLVLHQGDFSYDGVTSWTGKIDSTLGANFPYLGSVGNHDTNNWGDIRSGCTASTFAGYFRCKLDRIGVTAELGSNNQLYAVTYQGLRIVFANENPGTIGADWINQKLSGDPNIWKICSWHKNQNAMQVGGKGDEVGWGAYENCRTQGAIIATAHEHTYARTKTLTSTQNQTVDPTCSDPNSVCVSPGRTFVFHSGLGGNSIRNQDRCLPTTYPYGCKGEWAKIYTSDQGATYGALFIEFNVNGNPNLAHGYFKAINGQVIDDFFVTKGASGPTVTIGPTNTPTNTKTPTPAPTKTPTPTKAPTPKPGTPTPTPSGSIQGDIDGDGDVDIFDYNLLITNFGATGGNPADIDGDGDVDIFDYNLLITNFGRTSGTSTPTNTPPTSTPTKTPTPTSGTTITPPPSGGQGIWISPQRLAGLPTSGSAWNNVKSAADSSAGTPDLSNQDDSTNVIIMAKALVYARTGQTNYRSDVLSALSYIANSGQYSGRALALGRELAAYVISADLINLKSVDANLDSKFRAKIRELLTTPTSGGPGNLVECHEDRPNNWGTHCGGSRAAVAAYLGDSAELARVAQVFKGWLGDRTSYSGFAYGDLSWQCDSSKPVGINPKGCTKQGHSIDGVLPDDQRRGGGFTWPPPKENYVWGGLEGAHGQAVILYNSGYDVFNWQDKALLRAIEWLHEQANYTATGDDTWQPHITNFYYGTSFPAPVPSNPGKNVAWTDWTHAR